jgi:hypothetical protein
MAKMERERAVKEKRARKQERREEKKAAREAEAEGTITPAEDEPSAEL